MRHRGMGNSGAIAHCVRALIALALVAALLPTAGAGHSLGGAIQPDQGKPGSPPLTTIPAPPPIAPDPPPRPQAGRLDSALHTVAAEAARSRARGLDRARATGLTTSHDRVQVLLTIAPAQLDAVRAAIESAGGEVTGTGNRGRYMQAFVPVDALEGVAEVGGVRHVEPPPTFEIAAGSRMTQGDAALNGAAWRAAGVTGAGVKVGIIDVGFKGYKNLLGTDLPSSVTVRNFVDGQSSTAVAGGTPHGTACAEIIHDIAPQAQLYFARVATILDIEEAVTWLKGRGVHIISSSIGTYNVSPGDGTGYLEDIVADARAAGITWFTAASNDREAHWGGPANIGAGNYHVFDAGSGQQINYFGPGNGTAYALPANLSFRVYMRWSDWTSVTQDYDIHLWRWNGSSWQAAFQSGGTNEQAGKPGQRPVEAATGITSGGSTAYGWSIHRYDGSAPVNIEVFVPGFYRSDKLVHARSLSNLADSASAVTVAAIDVTSFNQESYSSEGPTNGPGGTQNGGLPKPDIAAYANVSTVSYSGSSFNGTSAATPHVAGGAALVRQANPSFSPTQLQGFLADRAIDLGSPGYDTQYGHGRVHLGDAPLVETDTAAPVVSAPNVNFRTGVNVAAKNPRLRVEVGFDASDPSGIASTQLQQRVDGGSYSNVTMASTASTSVQMRLPTNKTATRQFRARATDGAGNTSSYSAGPEFKVRAFQNGSSSITQTGTWKTASNSKHYGGSVRHSKAAGARQSLTAVMQDVAIVAMKAPKKGIAKVFVDGVEVATVDLYAPTKQFRQVVWAMDFGSAATHTVEFRVTGTKSGGSGGVRVDFDAFLVMMP